MRKRILAVLLLLVLCLSLVGCAGKPEKDPLLGKWNWYSVIDVDSGIGEQLVSEQDAERIWLFNEDGTGSDTMRSGGMEQTLNFKWSKTTRSITITANYYGHQEEIIYNYEISGDTMTVTVADERDNTLILKRAK